jgi:small GTP-binding protein
MNSLKRAKTIDLKSKSVVLTRKAARSGGSSLELLCLPNQKAFYDLSFKIVIVGDTNVGKTNLVVKFINENCHEETKSTIGVELYTKDFKINGNSLKIQIWDTAGQERYKSINSSFYKGVRGAIVVYDMTNEQSYINVTQWIQEIKNYAGNDVPIVVIANKLDMEYYRQIDYKSYWDELKSVPIIEASALEGTNVEICFKKLIYQID